MKERSPLGQLIRDAREAAGHTQESLAKELGVRQSNISDWERGAYCPSWGVLVRLADLLQLDIDTLVRAVADHETAATA